MQSAFSIALDHRLFLAISSGLKVATSREVILETRLTPHQLARACQARLEIQPFQGWAAIVVTRGRRSFLAPTFSPGSWPPLSLHRRLAGLSYRTPLALL